MRRVLVVLIIAGMLILALSVPALAAAPDTPNGWGQHRADISALMKGSEPVYVGELGIGWANTWGHDLLPVMKGIGSDYLGLNWGQFLKEELKPGYQGG